MDFRYQSPAHLVTSILRQCSRYADRTGEADEDFFWNLTIGKRIQCLLTIATEGGRSKLEIHLTCQNEDCRETMELELCLEDIATRQQTADETEFVSVGDDGRTYRLRRPTGRDQQEWLDKSLPDEDAAVREMVATLLIDERSAASAPSAWTRSQLEAFNSAMEDADPLPAMLLDVKCPVCGLRGEYNFDLERLALRLLEESQRKLRHSVHRLASAYHWNEREILAIPERRRRQYLDLIEKEER